MRCPKRSDKDPDMMRDRNYRVLYLACRGCTLAEISSVVKVSKRRVAVIINRLRIANPDLQPFLREYSAYPANPINWVNRDTFYFSKDAVSMGDSDNIH